MYPADGTYFGCDIGGTIYYVYFSFCRRLNIIYVFYLIFLGAPSAEYYLRFSLIYLYVLIIFWFCCIQIVNDNTNS